MKNTSLHLRRVTRAAVETARRPDQAEQVAAVFESSVRIHTAVQSRIAAKKKSIIAIRAFSRSSPQQKLPNRNALPWPILVENSVPCLFGLQLLYLLSTVHKQEGLALCVERTTPLGKERAARKVSGETQPSTSVSGQLVVA